MTYLQSGKSDEPDVNCDIFVDTNKAPDVYKRWLKMTRPAPGPDNLRRSLWLPRSYKPAPKVYYIDGKG